MKPDPKFGRELASTLRAMAQTARSESAARSRDAADLEESAAAAERFYCVEPTSSPDESRAIAAAFEEYCNRKPRVTVPRECFYAGWHAAKAAREPRTAPTYTATMRCPKCAHQAEVAIFQSGPIASSPGRCPHGYELANLADGTDTCSGCSAAEIERL